MTNSSGRWQKFRIFYAVVILLVAPSAGQLCTELCTTCTDTGVECGNVQIRLEPTHETLDVWCSGQTGLSDFETLRNVTDLTRFRFDRLVYRSCPLLSERSLPETLAFLGPDVTSIENLTLIGNNGPVSLEPSVFEGLDGLRILSVRDLKNVPENITPLLRNLPLLERFELSGTGLERMVKLAGATSLTEVNLNANRLVELPVGMFDELPELRMLVLRHNRLASLPEGLLRHNHNLTRFEAQGQTGQGLVLPDRLFADLKQLSYVSLADSGLTELPEHLFEGTNGLVELVLAGNSLTTLPEKLLQDLTGLLRLDLHRNELHTLPGTLFHQTNQLSMLDLSHNRLTTLDAELLKKLTKLKQLHLNRNELRVIDVSAFSGLQRSLRVLDLSHNRVSFRENGRGVFYMNGTSYLEEMFQNPFIGLDQLRTLNLSHNELVTMFADFKVVMPPLVELDISHNRIERLDATDFPLSSSSVALLDLRSNRIASINFTELGKNVRLPETIRLGDNPLHCDCRLGTLLQALQKAAPLASHLDTEFLRCASPRTMRGVSLRDLHADTLTCEITPEDGFCPDACSCQPTGRSVRVNCTGRNLEHVPMLSDPAVIGYNFIELHLEHNQLRKLPHIPDEETEMRRGWASVRKLFLSHNQLTMVGHETLPAELELLDVSGNQLVDIEPDFAQKLISKRSKPQLYLNLAENHWDCYCSATVFALVRDYSDFIAGNGTLRCSDGRLVDEDTREELCEAHKIRMVVLSGVLAIASVIAIVGVGLYYHFQQEIKMWLFVHGWLHWLVAEEELDKDKQYDAFISYSHKDEAFITEHLVPILEREPMSFKLCWHVRDWTPGEMITTQITTSVEQSRRTIIVLSANYIESMWGQLEFRTAYLQSVEDRRNRVIVIIYGDIGSLDELDPELRAYLKTNTYVRWDDPWFWDKLRYAMPHPRRLKGAQASDNIRMATVDKLNLLQASIGDPVPALSPESTPPIHHELANEKLGTNGGGPLAAFTISNGKLDLHAPE